MPRLKVIDNKSALLRSELAAIRAEDAAERAEEIAIGVDVPGGIATLDEEGKLKEAQRPSIVDIGGIPVTEKAVANGVATLDENGILNPSQVPSPETIGEYGVATLDVNGLLNQKPKDVVESVTELRQLKGKVGETALLKSYHEGRNRGGGVFYFSETDPYGNGDDGGIVFTADNDISGLSGYWVRVIQDTISVDWFGAYDDGTNPDITRDAIQNALNWTLDTGNPSYIVKLPGRHYAIDDTITKSGSFTCWRLEGSGRISTVLDYSSFLTEKPAMYIQGGSGQLVDGLISKIKFVGNTQTYGIEFDGQCGVNVRDCWFDTNLVGVLFHNKSSGSFTEYCVVHDSSFLYSCKRAVEYRRTGGTNSFHGSGLKGCTINQSKSETEPKILIGDGCMVYNAPLTVSMWTTNTVSLIRCHADFPESAMFYGDITVECQGSNNELVDTNYQSVYLTGHIHIFGDTCHHTRLILCERFYKKSNSINYIIRKPFNSRFTLTAETTNVGALGVESGGMAFISLHFVAANYDYQYLLLVLRDPYNSNNGKVTTIANPNSFNGNGWGAPTFSFANGGLNITNANFDTGQPTVYITSTQISSRYQDYSY